AASAYIIYSRVAELDWQAMYGYSPAAIIQVPPELKEFTKPSPSIQETITALINEESFQQISRGGPFGKDGQIRLARSRPATTFRMEDMSLLDTIKMRQTLWEKNYPWTEGLARLFDATQEELLYQNEVLSRDGRRAEAQFVSLSAFEKIAHKHLIDIRQKDVRSRNLGHGAWLELLRGLDAQKIPLDGQLRNKAKNVLDEVRRNGHKVHLWEDCYSAKLRASLDDGKIYNLRREVTHAIHNAARHFTNSAAPHFSCGRVFRDRQSPPSRTKHPAFLLGSPQSYTGVLKFLLLCCPLFADRILRHDPPTGHES